MRVILAGSLCLGILIILILTAKSSPAAPRSQHSSEPTPTMSLTPPPQSVDVTIHEKSYRIAWLLAPHTSAITLLPNFTQKRTAQSFIDTKECTHVINGGFYTTDYQPTGLFVAQGKTVRTTNPNALLNGYFVIEPNNTASIQYAPPESSVRIALQTGPILTRGGSPIKLAIQDDEFARRVGLGITKHGSIVFFVTYDPENTWSGPKLAEVPSVLSPLIDRLEIADAINLDGGSASAFIRDDFSLQELTTVGSFFCVR